MKRQEIDGNGLRLIRGSGSTANRLANDSRGVSGSVSGIAERLADGQTLTRLLGERGIKFNAERSLGNVVLASFNTVINIRSGMGVTDETLIATRCLTVVR
jgi:hypothetical protein